MIKESFDYVNKKYEAEAFEDGRKVGKKEIAKKLKGTLKAEEISKITGLSITTVESL